MADFTSSFFQWLKERANSPLYWTYFGFFITWNWEFFQVIFLEDARLFQVPRVEYLETFRICITGIGWVDWILNLLAHIGAPAIFTFVAIKWFPLIHTWALRIYSKNYFERRLIWQKDNVWYEQEKTELLKKKTDEKIKQIEQQEDMLEKTKAREEKWKKEFSEIKQTDLLNKIQKLFKIIYDAGGTISSQDLKNKLPSDFSTVFSFADIYSLIELEPERNGFGNNNIVKVSEKGKYFSRLLLDKGVRM